MFVKERYIASVSLDNYMVAFISLLHNHRGEQSRFVSGV